MRDDNYVIIFINLSASSFILRFRLGKVFLMYYMEIRYVTFKSRIFNSIRIKSIPLNIAFDLVKVRFIVGNSLF